MTILSSCLTVAILELLIPQAVSVVPATTQATPSASASAFLGLTVRDVPEVGCVVTWIEPGPLDGRGIESSTLARPDLLVSIDGAAASESALAASVAAKRPGDTIQLAYRRAATRSPNIPRDASTKPTYAEETKTVVVTLADAALWTGTFRQPPMPSQPWPLPTRAMLNPNDATSPLGKALAQEPSLATSLDRTIAAQRAMSDEKPDARRLARVTAAIVDPLILPELASACVAPARALAASRPVRCAATLAAEQLDVPLEPFEGHGSVPVADPQGGIFALDFLVNEGRLFLQEALGDVYANETFARKALTTMRGMRESLLIEGPGAADALAVIRRGAQVDMAPIIRAIAHLETEIAFSPDLAKSLPEELRDGLKGAVEGDVLTMEPIPDIGWAVVGGPGPNRYDMSKVAVVLDVGGDDTYTMSGLAVGMRAIIDLQGNDRYEGNAEQGMAAGVCGLFLIDDRAGNDTYSGHSLNAGAACFGAGLLIDRAGDDVYIGEEWSCGAACWGAGVLIDLAGDDSFRSEFLSQGCGGPRGVGALVDVKGNDRYDAEGSQPSQYGTAGVCSSFSQGMGFGSRGAAAGGIGILADLSGNDRYLAGEFAQGGGYFFGLGVLIDDGGNDCYWGNRYGQGWAAHQASGVLVDGGGDDTYVGMTAANQGAAWDQSTALLLDMGGNDSYQADGLAQGSAAQQAIAFLIDRGGEDRYVAASEIAQGHSGTNEYHFDQPPPIGGGFSWSLLMDLGGLHDFFSTGRPRDATMKLGSPDPKTPAMSTFDGLFIDEPPVAPPTPPR